MKIEKWCGRFVTYISFIIAAVLFAVSLFLTTQLLSVSDDSVFSHFNLYGLIVSIPIIIIFWLYNHYEEKINIQLIMVAILQVIIFLVIWSSNSVPTADQAIVEELARKFIDGNFTTILQPNYIATYPHQIGIVSLIYVVYSLFGVSIRILQTLNMIMVLLSYYYIYKIVNLINGKPTTMSIFIAVLFLPISIYSAFIYGESTSIAMSLGAIYFILKFLENSKYKYILFTFIVILIGLLARKNSVIVLIGIIVVLFIKMITDEKKLQKGVLILLLCFCYWMSDSGLKYLYTVKTGYSFSEGVSTTLYLAMGMQEGEQGAGAYNFFNTSTYVYESNFDSNKANKIGMESIKDSLKTFIHEPNYMINFYSRKIVNQWLNPDFGAFYHTYPSNGRNDFNSAFYENEAINGVILILLDGLQSVFYLGIILYFLFNRREPKINNSILGIIFIGGFLFSILWEAKSRYCMPYICFLIPYVTIGYKSCFNYIDGRLQK